MTRRSRRRNDRNARNRVTHDAIVAETVARTTQLQRPSLDGRCNSVVLATVSATIASCVTRLRALRSLLTSATLFTPASAAAVMSSVASVRLSVLFVL